MKHAKFLVSHFDAGVEKFAAGKAYPLDDETRLCIARGAAVEADATDERKPEVKANSDATEGEAGSAGESKSTDDEAAAGKPSGKGKK